MIEFEIRIWHMNAAIHRAERAVERAAKIRHADYWHDKYGHWSDPPPTSFIEAADALYAWKKAWLDYGEALKRHLRLNPPSVTAAVTTPNRGEQNG